MILLKKHLFLASLFVSLFSFMSGIAACSCHDSKTSSQTALIDSQPVANIEVQRTFSMIKPLAVQEHHIGEILARIEQAGFRIVALRMRTLSQDEAKRFYAEHASKPFFASLVQQISSGPVVMMVLEKSDAVSGLRQRIGATDPQQAAPGTIRHEFGRDKTNNAIHASDGPASAEREIALFFSEDEIAK